MANKTGAGSDEATSGRDRLARQDDAVDRRADSGLGKIGFVEIQVRLGHRRHPRGRSRAMRPRDRRPHCDWSRSCAGMACVARPALSCVRRPVLSRPPSPARPALWLWPPRLARNFDGRLQLVGIEFGKDLTRLNGRIVIDQHLAHGSRQLAGNVDLVGRLDGAGRGDDDGQVAARHRLRDVIDAVLAAAQPPDESSKQTGQRERQRPISVPGAASRRVPKRRPAES